MNMKPVNASWCDRSLVKCWRTFSPRWSLVIASSTTRITTCCTELTSHRRPMSSAVKAASWYHVTLWCCHPIFFSKSDDLFFLVILLKSDDRLPSRVVSPVFFVNSAKNFKLLGCHPPLGGVTRGSAPPPSDETVFLPSMPFLSFLPFSLSFSRGEVAPHIQLMDLEKRCSDINLQPPNTLHGL